MFTVSPISKIIALFIVLLAGLSLLEYQSLIFFGIMQGKCDQGEYLKAIVYLIAYCISILGILSIMLCSNRSIRVVGSLFIGLLICVNLSSIAILGQNVGLGDVSAAVSLPAFASTYIQSHLHSIVTASAFGGSLVLAFYLLASRIGARLHPVCLLSVPIGLIFVFIVTWVTMAVLDHFPSPMRIPMLVAYNSMSRTYAGPREEVSLRVESKGKPKHIIYIVDESVRGDLLTINGNAMDTTPFLMGKQSSILNLGIASSVTNISSGTNIALMSGLRVDQCPDIDQLALKNPTIFQFAKNAGYQTYFLDAQTAPGAYANFMRADDFKVIDHAVYSMSMPDLPIYERDGVLATELIRILNSAVPSFVYVNKYGAHADWRDSYPPGKSQFTPIISDGGSIGSSSKEAAMNTYANAVSWSVDAFFQQIWPHINSDEVVLIYTSDHGQSIKEGKFPSTHGDRVDPPESQANVPLFIIGKRAQALFPDDSAFAKNNSTHFQIFPSLLILMGYDSDAVIEEYDKPLWEEWTAPRVFQSGDIFSRGIPYINSFSIEPVR